MTLDTTGLVFRQDPGGRRVTGIYGDQGPARYQYTTETPQRHRPSGGFPAWSGGQSFAGPVSDMGRCLEMWREVMGNPPLNTTARDRTTWSKRWVAGGCLGVLRARMGGFEAGGAAFASRSIGIERGSGAVQAILGTTHLVRGQAGSVGRPCRSMIVAGPVESATGRFPAGEALSGPFSCSVVPSLHP